jgi:outer membrane protein
MKKIIAILVLAAGLVSGTVDAQTKFGFIRVDEMVSHMPELKKIDTQLVSYQNDSLPRTYNYLLSQYRYYDSIASDSLKQTAIVRQQASNQRAEFLVELQNWQSTASQLIEAKQNSLLQPVYDKVLKAIDDVAKEKGYGYVFNREALLVGPPADNLLQMVADKLKVKLPTAPTQNQTSTQQKPPGKTGN